MLELADRSRIKHEGVLDDEIVSLDSLEYPIDFFVLQPKSISGGDPVVLGRPWLTTADAFIGCRSGDMYLPRGNSFKQVSIYPTAKAITKLQDETWFEKEPSDGESSQPIFTIDQIGSLKQPSEENQITNFLCDAEPIYHSTLTDMDLEKFFGINAQENSDLTALHSLSLPACNVCIQPETTLAEISPGKFLHLNPELEKQHLNLHGDKLRNCFKVNVGITTKDFP